MFAAIVIACLSTTGECKATTVQKVWPTYEQCMTDFRNQGKPQFEMLIQQGVVDSYSNKCVQFVPGDFAGGEAL